MNDPWPSYNQVRLFATMRVRSLTLQGLRARLIAAVPGGQEHARHQYLPPLGIAMQTGMSRRHFLSHVAGASALALPGMNFIQGLRAAQTDLKKQNKSLVILWMGGGPTLMDLWDLKPGA